ncbi:hypothetical protein M493_08215 [Geobacillus genomosp. 3]|uniref:Uncharacterized protein n=1 Tax=Geobacillus genomosp. 3 TaxID=1921421 RepID=S5Z4Q6_GEOG3|nr:hypothetical protein [Geobacillus genomosp. 3]AGT31922.1 hypothetical protein M493_08215 [Geobacillus genomosp. 3]
MPGWRTVIAKAPFSFLRAGNVLKEQTIPSGDNEQQAKTVFPSLETLRQIFVRIEAAGDDDSIVSVPDIGMLVIAQDDSLL